MITVDNYCEFIARVKYAVNKETNEAVAIKVLDKVRITSTGNINIVN